MIVSKSLKGESSLDENNRDVWAANSKARPARSLVRLLESPSLSIRQVLLDAVCAINKDMALLTDALVLSRGQKDKRASMVAVAVCKLDEESPSRIVNRALLYVSLSRGWVRERNSSLRAATASADMSSGKGITAGYRMDL